MNNRANTFCLILLAVAFHAANIAWGGGMVVAWGYNYFGQTNVPAGLSNVVAIAAGDDSSVALQKSGLVTVWGIPSIGALSNAVAVAAGNLFCLALRADGTVIASGQYWDGVCCYLPMYVPSGLSNVVAIAAGGESALALRANGTVAAWGGNYWGQNNVPAGLSNVVMVAAASAHSLALRSDGTVVAWGSGGQGETNVPAGLSNAVAIAAGNTSNLALRNDGTVAAWGHDSSGVITDAARLSNVVAIASAAGDNHCLALQADNTLVAWGLRSYGLGNVPAGLSNVVGIAAGGLHSLVLVGDEPLALQATLMNPRRDAEGFSVSLPSQSGRVYRLEFVDSVTDGNWAALLLVAGNGGLLTLVDPTVIGTQRFYRVRRW